MSCLTVCVSVFTGDRVHYSGQGTGAPQALSQGSLRYYAGLLAEGATTAPQHQGHSEDAIYSDESHTSLSGHTGIKMDMGGKEWDVF